MKIEEVAGGWSRVRLYNQEDADMACARWKFFKPFIFPEQALEMSFYVNKDRIPMNLLMIPREGISMTNEETTNFGDFLYERIQKHEAKLEELEGINPQLDCDLAIKRSNHAAILMELRVIRGEYGKRGGLR